MNTISCICTRIFIKDITVQRRFFIVKRNIDRTARSFCNIGFAIIVFNSTRIFTTVNITINVDCYIFIICTNIYITTSHRIARNSFSNIFNCTLNIDIITSIYIKTRYLCSIINISSFYRNTTYNRNFFSIF